MSAQRATTAIPANSRGTPKAAWSLCGLTFVLLTSGVVFGILNDTHAGELVFLVSVISCAVVGGMVASNRPANPIGWFFLASALSFAATIFTGEYARYGLLTEPGSLPAARAVVWPQSWTWVPGAVLIVVFVPLYFPDGRLVSRRWRPVVWSAALFSVLGAGLSALQPGEIQGSGLANPLGTELPQAVAAVFDAVVLPLWLGLLFVSAASLVVRFRRSGREERQQIKWLAFAAAVIPVWFLLNAPVERAFPNLFLFMDSLALAGVPVAAGIAILRHRLYDIDLVINRTLVYGALTACVVGVYVVVVGYLGQVFHADDNLLISIIATGIVAALFAPLRDRLQRGVNRLTYGERDDPYSVLSRLGERLEATLEPHAVLPAVAETVAHALKVPHVAIELKRGDEYETVAEYGRPSGEPLRRPLIYGTETVGRIVLSPRGPGESFGPADHRLLEGLARQAGVAAHAVRLTDDLQRSREHLVTAREEERRRMRRNLHDGLGPALSSAMLKLGAARRLLTLSSPADDLIVEVRDDLRTTVADVRGLVYDLRPPALDQLGLMPAIHDYAQQCASEDENGLRIMVDVPEQLPPLPAAVEVAAYYIAREAIANVARHARARCCRVHLMLRNEPDRVELRMEISDDGVGVPNERHLGVGLTSMRERAEELGGKFSVESSPEEGTRILARLPIGKK